MSAVYFIYAGELVSHRGIDSDLMNRFSTFWTFNCGDFLVSVRALSVPISLAGRLPPCRLLGLSAFAGFIILIAGWPLNSYIARRSIRIQKGVLSARDKRMGVLNELIGAVSVLSWRKQHLRLLANRLNSSNFLLGKNDGSGRQWTHERWRWNGWLNVYSRTPVPWYLPILTRFIYSSCQLGPFLSPLDMRANFYLHHLLHDLCDARKSIDG